MNLLQIVKKTSLALSLAIIFGIHVEAVSGRDDCQFSKTQCEILRSLEGVLREKFNNCMLNIHAIFVDVACIGDSTITSGSSRRDSHPKLEDIKFDGIIKIVLEYADELDDIADQVQGKTGQRIHKLADDIRAVCGLIHNHITENSKMAARLPLPLKKLQQKLEPYKYFMPHEFEQPGKSDAHMLKFWGTIIAALY